MAKQTVILLLLPFLLAATIRTDGPGDPWKAPPQADQLKDPLAGDPKAMRRGEKVFTALCWTCHGMRGQGDGPNASELRVAPSDLGAPVVQAQTNGALYWKITHGRGEMAAYEQVLASEERWAVVHYLRILAHP
ncbi:MAG: cytochrome c [Flavobacteriales bacterium]|nr:cytochrome c [Flavobacteriales bacterium]